MPENGGITTSLYQRIKTIVTLDDDLFEAAKAQAKASGKRLGLVLSRLTRSGIRASTATGIENGVPLLKGRPDAEIIPSSRVRELPAKNAT